MNRSNLHKIIPWWFRTAVVILCSVFASSNISAASCDQIKTQPDAWVKESVDALVLAARRAYESDDAQTAYERVLDGITRAMGQCRLAQEKDFVARYPEFTSSEIDQEISRLSRAGKVIITRGVGIFTIRQAAVIS